MPVAQLTVVTIMDDTTKKKLLLQGNWSEESVKLLLNDNDCTWTGEFKASDVPDEVLTQLETDRSEYMNMMKNALGSTTVDNKYKYCFHDDSLTWYKNISLGVSQRQGLIPLIPVKMIEQGPLIYSLLNNYSIVLDESGRQAALRRRYQKDLEEASATLKNCVDAKKQLEVELYSKFALILNEKKEYVRRMTNCDVDENFGPQLPLSSHQPVERNTEISTCTVSLRELSKMSKCGGGNDEPAFKKRALDSKPTTSASNDDNMESD